MTRWTDVSHKGPLGLSAVVVIAATIVTIVTSTPQPAVLDQMVPIDSVETSSTMSRTYKEMRVDTKDAYSLTTEEVVTTRSSTFDLE